LKKIVDLDPNERAACARCNAPDGEPRLVSRPQLVSLGDIDSDEAGPIALTKRFVCARCAARSDHGMFLLGLTQ
jgi:hypothetical protein